MVLPKNNHESFYGHTFTPVGNGRPSSQGGEKGFIMAGWRWAIMVGVMAVVAPGTIAAGDHWHKPRCHHHTCQCHCKPCGGMPEWRRSYETDQPRNLPMILPIIETAPIFASPVVYSTQRTLVAPQFQTTRAAVLRTSAEPEADPCIPKERLEKLEDKVDDLSKSFDDLREVVLQQAQLMNEIAKRLPEKP